MKTAEEWLHVDNFPNTLDPAYANENFAHWVDKIQLDALQEAARVAIKLTRIPDDAIKRGTGVRDRTVIDGEKIATAILSLASNLTNGGTVK